MAWLWVFIERATFPISDDCRVGRGSCPWLRWPGFVGLCCAVSTTLPGGHESVVSPAGQAQDVHSRGVLSTWRVFRVLTGFLKLRVDSCVYVCSQGD